MCKMCVCVCARAVILLLGDMRYFIGAVNYVNHTKPHAEPLEASTPARIPHPGIFRKYITV